MLFSSIEKFHFFNVLIELPNFSWAIDIPCELKTGKCYYSAFPVPHSTGSMGEAHILLSLSFLDTPLGMHSEKCRHMIYFFCTCS